MCGWYVVNEYGEIFCKAENRTEAEQIAEEINGYTVYKDIM